MENQLQNVSDSARNESAQFLAISEQFRLGGLLTEQPHKHTEGLSEFAKNDLPTAINRMRDLDLNVWDVLVNKIPELEQIYVKLVEVLSNKNRVYICGCGSTGRLALTLETLYRQLIKKYELNEFKDSVISFMAGGDVAIINSVEDFEDHPEFGAQQLNELDFKPEDLLIASTEGGETPWVIGATIEASKISKHKPFYLYCNPDEVLFVERSQQVISNPNIIKINLTVGNQAITGSTRMQCSTILTQGIGLPLFYAIETINGNKQSFSDYSVSQLVPAKEYYKNADLLTFLTPFIEAESQVYKENNFLIYRSSADFGINILTDTTERSPTFSLFPFEGNLDKPINPSLVYFILEDQISETPQDAWNTLFYGRSPRALNSEYWTKYKHKVSTEKMMTHDISKQQIDRRIKYCQGAKLFYILIERVENKFIWEFGNQIENQILIKKEIGQLPENILQSNIILKCMLNTLSVLVMGRLGRFFSNIMIYVRPSNNKLKDRSIRYVQYLLEQHRKELDNKEICDYQTICLALHQEIESLVYGEAVVLKTFNRICRELYGKENLIK